MESIAPLILELEAMATTATDLFIWVVLGSIPCLLLTCILVDWLKTTTTRWHY